MADRGGNKILLDVDYENGRFALSKKTRGEGDISRLKREIELVAENLINRKRGVNFSDNIKI